MINRKFALYTASFLIVVALLSPWICPMTQAQSNYTFEPKNKFTIPEHNGSIRFAASGTYEQANPTDGAWHFINLRLNNSYTLQDFKVSAKNSNITITSYIKSNATLGATRLRYNVEGQGTQTLNFGSSPRSGKWSVILNGVFVAENNGWKIAPDNTLTLTGATANVSVSYYYFPESFDDRLNQPFYQRHSVSIIATIAAAATVVLAVTIAVKTKKKQDL